jgi:DeoR/GlpR family transcriptional regulator of sugar metabolism
MLKKERQAFILHQLDLHNRVLSSTLCTEMQVSEDTIRRDLQELAEEGQLIKVHGGALSRSYNNFYPEASQVYSRPGKKVIAEKTSSLIRDGMFVLTLGGTTIQEMARTLPPDLKATFITGSIPAVIEYMHHPSIDVILIGDRVSKTAKITAGGDAIARIGQICADLCILGVNAIDITHGVTDNDWDVVQVKRAMIAAAEKVICVSILEKINTYQPLQVCSLDQIDMLITEADPDNPLLIPYREAGIDVR